MPITNQTVGPESTLLMGTQGSGTTPVMIVNQDSSNTIYVADQSNVMYGGTVGLPLGPGSSISLMSATGLYACSNGPQVPVALIPQGSNYFLPPSLSSLGGVKVYIQASMPVGTANLPIGSLWLETNASNVVTGWYYWTGTAWVQQTFNATDVITAGTIVANLIAAGTVVAGMVNGTVVEGAQLIGDGRGEELMIYSGTPAEGNLIMSVSYTAGTDSHGNKFQDGITSYGTNGGYLQITADPTTGIPYLSFNAAGTRAVGGSLQPQITGTFGGSTEAAQYTELNLQSGYSTTGGSYVALTSSSEDGSTLTNVSIGVQNADTPTVFTPWFVASSLGLWCPQQLMAIEPGTTLTPETWHVIGTSGNPAFGTGFTSGTADQAPRFMIDAFGFVHLDGTVYTSAATAANATMFTLPTGYRPSTDRRRFVGLTNVSGWTAGATTVEVLTTGAVELPVAASGSGQQIVLDGISFPVN